MIKKSTSRELIETSPTIVLNLLSYKDKELVLKNSKKLSGTGIYINEDYSEETMKIRKQLRVQMREERAKGKFCVLKYDQLFIRNFKDKNEKSVEEVKVVELPDKE